MNLIENNKVSITGEIISNFLYSHEICSERFFIVKVRVDRLSGDFDIIPCMVSERIIDVSKDYYGEFVEVFGQFRSYNKHSEDGNKLMLSVFVQDCTFVEADEVNQYRANAIYLDGFICKPPIYRKTPLGREIADLLVAVNRPYGKSDYIPCIAWGRNAHFAESFEVGRGIKIWGRVQSRDYVKRIDGESEEKRTAYEVSVSRMEYER